MDISPLKNNHDRKDDAKVWSAYQLALTLGYMIVIPMVLFGVGGVMLDKHFNSYPLFIFIGFLFALTSSMFVVYTKTKDIVIQGMPQKPKSKIEKPNLKP
ncbi:MAG: AtpZ/AtpI family protein [Candidatus Gracilibacteria bacterium]